MYYYRVLNITFNIYLVCKAYGRSVIIAWPAQGYVRRLRAETHLFRLPCMKTTKFFKPHHFRIRFFYSSDTRTRGD